MAVILGLEKTVTGLIGLKTRNLWCRVFGSSGWAVLVTEREYRSFS